MRTALLLLSVVVVGLVLPAKAFMPYGRYLWDMMLPTDDPFRILEQSPLTITKAMEIPVALARADWKETPLLHVITLDVPGVSKEEIKIEIEENRVLRISGERKGEEEVEGEKWHKAERTNGKFWRQFRLPGNADLDTIKAHLEDGVMRITVQKLAEEKKRQPKVVNIVEQGSKGHDIKASEEL